MKNNIFKFLIIFFYFFQNNLLAEQFNIESSEINILKEGDIVHAKNGVNIFSNDGIKIESNEAIYDKKKEILKLYGNVKISDKVNKFIAENTGIWLLLRFSKLIV